MVAGARSTTKDPLCTSKTRRRPRILCGGDTSGITVGPGRVTGGTIIDGDDPPESVFPEPPRLHLDLVRVESTDVDQVQQRRAFVGSLYQRSDMGRQSNSSGRLHLAVADSLQRESSLTLQRQIDPVTTEGGFVRG